MNDRPNKLQKTVKAHFAKLGFQTLQIQLLCKLCKIVSYIILHSLISFDFFSFSYCANQ